MITFDTQALIELTVEWLEYLDTFQFEGCTPQDIDMALQTNWGEGPALREAVSNLTVREWNKIQAEVIESVNTRLFDVT